MTRAVRLSDLPPDVRAKLAGKRGRPATTRAVKAIEEAQKQFRRDLFFAMLTKAKLPMPLIEYQFDAKRMWRMDYAWPDRKIALEVEGGAWTQGRHNRGGGFIADMQKYNAAAVQGWRVLRTVPDSLTSNAIEQALRIVLR